MDRKNLYQNALYCEDVASAAALNFPWEQMHQKRVLITGASGMIGSFLTDLIMYKNRTSELECTVTAVTRNEKLAKERFSNYSDDPFFRYLCHDVNRPLSYRDTGPVHFIFHLASNTHPLQYATDPIATIETNVLGTSNLLKFAADQQVSRFVFASSVEIYGENRGDTELFAESDLGYIDCNTLRAGYPEAKRCGEALCQAYIAQAGLDVVIPRLPRTFGPTMRLNDSKAVSQFLKRAIEKKDIILKSDGKQYYSFLYTPDTVSGLLTAFFYGRKGEAYNVAQKDHDCTLREIAEMTADIVGTRVIYQVPDQCEASGYSKASKARLDGRKLSALGWIPNYTIPSGLRRTVEILNYLKEA